jgi:hypothetical protein
VAAVSYRLPVLLVPAALLSGGPAAPPPPVPTPPLYFPTSVGTARVYRQGNREFADKVCAVENKDGVYVVTMGRRTTNRWLPGRGNVFYVPGAVMVVSVAGVFQLSCGFKLAHAKAGFDPPLCLLKLPHRPEDCWHWEFPEGRGPTHTPRGAEVVEVPAGRFRAVRVDSEPAGGGEGFRETHWYAPGVGLVKAVSDDGSGPVTCVLTSFTPGDR